MKAKRDTAGACFDTPLPPLHAKRDTAGACFVLAPHTDCFEHVQGANFVFFDGKSGYFGDRTMEMYHIRRGFQKYRRGGGRVLAANWTPFEQSPSKRCDQPTFIETPT